MKLSHFEAGDGSYYAGFVSPSQGGGESPSLVSASKQAVQPTTGPTPDLPPSKPVVLNHRGERRVTLNGKLIGYLPRGGRFQGTGLEEALREEGFEFGDDGGPEGPGKPQADDTLAGGFAANRLSLGGSTVTPSISASLEGKRERGGTTGSGPDVRTHPAGVAANAGPATMLGRAA